MGKTEKISTSVTEETARTIELLAEVKGVTKSEYARSVLARVAREDLDGLDEDEVRRALVAVQSDEAEVDDEGRVLPPAPHELLG